MIYSKILIVGNRLIGDAIDSLHSVYSLYLQNPKADYFFIGFQYSTFLYESIVPFKEKYYLPSGSLKSFQIFLKFWIKFQKKIDLIFILPGGWGWGFWSFLLRAKYRVGHCGDYRSLFLTHHRLVERWVANYENYDRLFHLLYPQIEISRTALKVKPFDLEKYVQTPFVIFSIMASEPSKIWSQKKFIELAQKIKKKFDVTIVLVGTGSERKVIDEVAKHSQVAGINLAGMLEIESVFYLMKKSMFFVGNDSGLTHAAALLGVPSFSIIGPTNPTLSFPYVALSSRSSSQTDERGNTFFIYHDFEGIPHHLRRLKKYQKKLEINLIATDEVWKKIEETISQ